MTAATLIPREFAELSGAPRRIVEKVILPVRFRTSRRAAGRPRRMLPALAVAYAALMMKLDLRPTLAHKRRFLDKLAHLKPSDVRTARVELAPAVEINVGRLIGDVMDRAERYHVTRDASIVIDEAIMGGTPMIRGTRMTVYSVLGRFEHGETIEDIVNDNPHLSREAVEATITFARTHPLMGRPGGRPWARAA